MLGKWESIDDEIWAKVIVLERNRRVAKAYARAPVLTINGSDEGFDGFRYVYFKVKKYLRRYPGFDPITFTFSENSNYGRERCKAKYC